MTQSTQPLPSVGAFNSTEDPKARSLLAELQGIVNGGIDSSNITDGSIAKTDLAGTALQAFLQLATNVTRKVAFGTAVASTNVSSNIVGGTVAHTLGVAPVFAAAIITVGSSTGPINAVCTGVQSADATNVQFYFQGVNGADITASSVTFYWLAIG